MESHNQPIDARQLSLDEWLALVRNPPKEVVFVDYEFPTQQHLDEFLARIGEWSEADIYLLLDKFLFASGSFEIDGLKLEGLKAAKRDAPELFRLMISSGFYRRLVRYAASPGKSPPPWEGNTWILDLLPHFPKEALEGLNAYILAHAQFLPDGRYNGLHEAAAVIRARYIGIPRTQTETIKTLLELSSRDFEHLVECLYYSMGYETELTPAQKDGGRDILAWRRKPGMTEDLRIECKRYSQPVGVGTVRALLGVVSSEKVNKGVLVTTCRFTKPARDFARLNPRVELISGDEFTMLMNEHEGAMWPLHIERLISESKRRTEAT
jgi:restriction system protein